MTDNYKDEQCANYGEEIAARELERQREDGRQRQTTWSQLLATSDFLFNAAARNQIDEEQPY